MLMFDSLQLKLGLRDASLTSITMLRSMTYRSCNRDESGVSDGARGGI